MTKLAILLLAAGASRRMRGADKLLQQVNGRPLLTLMAARAIDTGFATYVAVPGADHPRRMAIASAQPVYVTDADLGMSASIRAGVAALGEDVDGVIILPADMPEVETSDMLCLGARFDPGAPHILRAVSASGSPGHPVLFPRRYFPELLNLTGDEGARAVLRQHTVEFVPLPGDRALIDLDTPEDWARWRAAHSKAQTE